MVCVWCHHMGETKAIFNENYEKTIEQFKYAIVTNKHEVESIKLTLQRSRRGKRTKNDFFFIECGENSML